jgi:hypothetical protein
MPRPRYAFYDCMDFYSGGRRGLALSDPVDGKFRIAATDDFGRTWHVLPNTGMPDAVTGEFATAPIPASEDGGVFSLEFRNPRHVAILK